jgi:Nif-specific regulatory protein
MQISDSTATNFIPNQALVTSLLSSLEEGSFFHKLASYVWEAMGDKRVEIFLAFNDETTQMVATHEGPVSSSSVVSRGIGTSGQVAKTKRPYFSNNVKRDPIYSDGRLPESIYAEMVIPMMIDGVTLGTLHIQSDRPDRNFGEKDVIKLKDIFQSVALPMENMKNYLMVKYLNKELVNKLEKQNETTYLSGNSDSSYNIEIIGHDNRIVDAIKLANRTASEEFPILIEGPIGTGKRLFAKKIHQVGQRKSAPFNIFECAVKDENNMEKELFGYGDRAGLLESSNGGVVVFNDVHELSLGMQSKLIQIMTSGNLCRIGSKDKVAINVRFIATAKKSLKREVLEKRFREDLYYRLSTVTITLAGLTERKEDIKFLADYYLNLGKSQRKTISTKVLAELTNHNWSANVTELRNIMERSYMLTDGKIVESIDLLQSSEFDREVVVEKVAASEYQEVTLFDLERAHILKTLEHLNGNKTRAAKSLGITVKTLYNKLHSYGIFDEHKTQQNAVQN